MLTKKKKYNNYKLLGLSNKEFYICKKNNVYFDQRSGVVLRMLVKISEKW